jgi:hypothetical protein
MNTFSQPNSARTTLILSSHLRLGLSSGVFFRISNQNLARTSRLSQNRYISSHVHLHTFLLYHPSVQLFFLGYEACLGVNSLHSEFIFYNMPNLDVQKSVQWFLRVASGTERKLSFVSTVRELKTHWTPLWVTLASKWKSIGHRLPVTSCFLDEWPCNFL